MPLTEPFTASRAADQPVAEKENRRIQRIALPLPVRVEVRVDKNVNWYEITRLSDVSAFGAGFVMKRPIKRGRLVLLTLPMPRQLRSYDYSEPQYKIWGLVRSCIPTGRSARDPLYSVGAAFIGKHPPADYIEHPARLYDLISRDDSSGVFRIGLADLRADESHLPKEVRKQTRYFIPETITIKKTDDDGTILVAESTVTENISLGGAAVFTSLDLAPGSFVRAECDRLGIEILCVVRGSRVGADGLTRLHLEFVDRFFPLEGLE